MLEKHIFFLYRCCNQLHYKGYTRKTIKWFLSKVFIKVTYKYYSLLLSVFYGAYLPYQAKIGKNLKLYHSFHGIFISMNSSIGDNCGILHHVTIGSNQPKSEDAPIIGNHVFIGVNCSIVGKVTIGDYCTIGAGTVITNAIIEDNSVVVGQKFRVIRNQKLNEK